jgi:YHS domain-containing protein
VKLLLLIVIAYLFYRAGKSWLMKVLQGPLQNQPGNPRIDDVMVKDPVCGIYFPQREGVELRHRSQIHLFCSEACRDQFIEDEKGR